MGVIDFAGILKAGRDSAVSKDAVRSGLEIVDAPAAHLGELEALCALLEQPEKPDLHFYTQRAWSMHQLFAEVVRSLGDVVEVWITTYAVSETAARMLAQLKAAGRLGRLNLLLDSRAETRSAASLQLLRANADRLTMTPCHAKVVILERAGGELVGILGSANFTENRRFEVGQITRQQNALEMHLTWIKTALENGY